VIDLLSVNVAQPAIIGTRRGQPVLSGFCKRPVRTKTVEVGSTNIAGDAQADLRAHGGPDKAVYAYSADHFPWWSKEIRAEEPYGPGALGENLTVGGVDENDVCIGDIWQWGEAVLQICQPRYPCYKMAMATARPTIVRRFLESGRSGWYLRVLETGCAEVAGPIIVLERDSARISVRDAALAASHPTEPERQIEIAAHPALAERWADRLRHLAISTI
jgi:MOSC domain-containing protein YiiM